MADEQLPALRAREQLETINVLQLGSGMVKRDDQRERIAELSARAEGTRRVRKKAVRPLNDAKSKKVLAWLGQVEE